MQRGPSLQPKLQEQGARLAWSVAAIAQVQHCTKRRTPCAVATQGMRRYACFTWWQDQADMLPIVLNATVGT